MAHKPPAPKGKRAGRLLIPVKIGRTLRLNARAKGTRAFVEQGNDTWKRMQYERQRKRVELVRFLRNTDKRKKPYRGRKQKYQSDVNARYDAWAQSKLAEERRMEIAKASDFYVKPISAKTKRIRELLAHAGVDVEQPLAIRNLDDTDKVLRRRPTDLGGDLELFKRSGHVPVFGGRFEDTYSHQKDRKRAQLQDMVVTMHRLGITHNDLNAGNVVMDPKTGRLKLIDLSTAEIYKKQPVEKRAFLERYAHDLSRAAGILVGIHLDGPPFPRRMDEEHYELQALLSRFKKAGIPTFGVTPKEIDQKAHEIDNRQTQAYQRRRQMDIAELERKLHPRLPKARL